MTIKSIKLQVPAVTTKGGSEQSDYADSDWKKTAGLERAKKKLKDLLTQQKLILNAVGQGIYGVNNEGFVTFMNPAAEKMLGWTFRELKNKRLHNIIHYTKGDHKTPLSFKQCINYKIRQRTKDPTQIDTEIFWRKNGSFFPVEYIITPLPDNKKISGAVVTFNDITKRKELEYLKKDFLATAAHELKTPITTLKILTQFNLARLNKKLPINEKELGDIDAELDRLTRIIDDILDDQRVETGKLRLKIDIIDINSLINKILLQMRRLSDKHILIYKHEEKIEIPADADRLSQVFTNLISNSIKYSKPGTEITVMVKKHNNKVIIEVNDRGIGIAKENHEKIFDRFYQIQERKYSGFGIGLYIAKQIIERHHGKIWVKSKVGKGSSFFISLPLI